MKAVSIFILAAMSVVALAAGCSSAQKDQSLSTEIKAKMFSDPQVKAANVEVAVHDGEATVSGEVPNDTVRYQAYKLASDTPGVKHVTDKMTVQAAQVTQDTPPVNPARDVLAPAPRPERKTTKHTSKPDPKPAVKSAEYRTERSPDPPPAPAAPIPAAQPAVSAAPSPAVAAPAPAPPPQPRRIEIPAGTPVRVQMIDAVDSAVNHEGEVFHASLDSPIVVDDQIIVPAGADMEVKLTTAKSAGHMTGQSTLSLELVRMEFQGKSYTLASDPYLKKGSSRGKRTAETVGGGAVLGTLLGAVIGGGKGAAIGAATGAGAGGVVQGTTKGQQIKIPSESKLDFTLEQPVEISYFPDRNHSQRP